MFQTTNQLVILNFLTKLAANFLGPWKPVWCKNALEICLFLADKGEISGSQVFRCGTQNVVFFVFLVPEKAKGFPLQELCFRSK